MKKFLIIGTINAITCKDIFNYIKNNELWMGINNVHTFNTPNGGTKTFGNIGWYTNLTHPKRNEEIYLYKTYNTESYPKYDNYDAINIDRAAYIPIDYFGKMGVPISFYKKLNRNQFEIIGIMTSYDKGQPFILGKKIYVRLVIKRKIPEKKFHK